MVGAACSCVVVVVLLETKLVGRRDAGDVNADAKFDEVMAKRSNTENNKDDGVFIVILLFDVWKQGKQHDNLLYATAAYLFKHWSIAVRKSFTFSGKRDFALLPHAV